MLEWDEDKSQHNLTARGFDFAFAARIFDGDTIEREDARRDYGERRMIAIGMVEGAALVVVYVLRGDVLRIILGATSKSEGARCLQTSCRTLTGPRPPAEWT